MPSSPQGGRTANSRQGLKTMYGDEEYFRPNEFFEKPVDKDVLLDKINQYLG